MVKNKFHIHEHKHHKGCKRCGQYTPSYDAVKSPLCGSCEKKSCFEEEEEICEEEVFDMSQIRYRLDCFDNSKLRNFGIEKGARLDYVIEKLWKKMEDLEYVHTPRVPNKPRLDTFQAIVVDLYSIIEKQSQEIDKLKNKIK